MAEGIAFHLVTGVLGKLGTALGNEIGLLWSFKDDADDLRSNFSAIQAVLLDAEERSIVEKETHALCDWLRKLKDAAYDADDLLDEIRTQALLRKQQQRELQNQNQLAKMVCDRFLSCANPINLMFKCKMAHRMKELRANINKITKQMHDFHLDKPGPSQQTEMKDGSDDRETVSSVEKEKIVGRDDDTEEIVKLLLETNDDHDLSVIRIVGMGGLGKTTLARLAFNDGRVTAQQVFDLRVWVYVTTDFDMKKIAEAVKSTTSGEGDLTTKESSKSFLLETFSQKKFLLVLDDVWNEDQDKWDHLKVLFKAGKKGSKVLVTTRSDKVADIMVTTGQPFLLKGLSNNDCWTLFKRRAFKEGEENSYPSLVEIGKQMVNKCGGVPLAAKALGSMIRSKSRTDVTWSAMRDSEIWRLEEKEKDSSKKKDEKILPSLKLSYIQMPSSALKHSFAYCSVFPKGYKIDKDDLIQQWIALGFISSPDTSTLMEDIGNEYFNELLWGYFLQEVEDGKEFNGEVTYRMHDLMHDLARSVARDEVAVRVEEESTGIPEGCRYASIYSSFVSQVPTTVVRRLRALRYRESASLKTFYSKAKCLRLLKLDDGMYSMLPSSIGKLKLLRYLDLSETSIDKLPESITSLCNLQTLNLSGCRNIHTLPKSLGRLANLRILNLSSCHSLTLLDSISNLQNLCTLNLSWCDKVKSLEPICHLKNLHYLDLSHLDSLATLPESIKSLQNLRILNLSGCTSLESFPSSLWHLKNLHDLNLLHLNNLRELPESIGSLQNLRILNLSCCYRLRSLPSSLCDLKKLHDLNLSRLHDLQALPESIGSLQNLRILNLNFCDSLLSLPSSSSDLQHLEKLDISICGKLRELPKMIQNPSKLRELLNKDCLELKAMPRGIGNLVSLRKLPLFVIGKQDCAAHCASISELKDLRLVGNLEIEGLKNVTNPANAKAANLIEKNLRSLKLKWYVLNAAEGTDTVLSAEEMDTVLENLQPHQNVENLEIEGYGGGKFSSWMMNKIGSCLPNLIEIRLVNMPRCSSLPPLGQLPFLKVLSIWNAPLLTNIGFEFYGDSHISASANKFPALTRLGLVDMPVLREWVTVLTVDDKEGRQERVPIFPRLIQLELIECPQFRPEPCLPASVENLTISRTREENLSLILERATPHDDGDGDAVSLQLPNRGLQHLTIEECQQVTCLPKSLRSLTSLQSLSIWDCGDLERIEDWLGDLTDLQSLTIFKCKSLRYLPAHKMTKLNKLFIEDCPLLFNAGGQFVDTSVDHIEDVYVNRSRTFLLRSKKHITARATAEGIASDLVTGVLGVLGTALGNEIGLLWSFKDDADDLRRNFLEIQAVLHDAEERSIVETEENELLRIWLSELKGAAYDIDDLLNEIRTQALLRKQQQRELQNKNQPAKMVCNRFLSCANPMHLKFKFEMAHRMKELRTKIKNIAKQKNDFGLGPRPQAEFKRPETIAVVDEKKIVGRDVDKEKIVKLLLETGGDHDVSVIPIVGLGGLGKTTLAQLAFNDGQVTAQQVFDLRVWVCVSTDLDMKTIARSVISATGEKCDNLDNLESVVWCAVGIFSQKRFLLVLDDVWNEDQGKWEELKVLFKDGMKGSKILVTTRSEKVAEIMKTTEQPHRLNGLSDDDCWTLFKRRAFKEGEENDDPRLVEIGKQIVKKCGGVPLAAQALGSLMRFKSRTEDAWSAIKDSKIWELEEEKEILPSLKLSYIRMPSALKQCFAYCSIFPKDYEIDKDDLIRQWIALGFISSHETSSSMEDIGNEYFNNLLWMSFLKDVEETNGEVTCRMHDLVHDLAQSIAREEVAVIVGEDSTSMPEGCRYASINSHSMPLVSNTEMRRLRALRFRESASPMTFYSEAKCLRLLDLHDCEISVLPSSIGKLKLLRYLRLSSTSIQELPESITGLCNLQTLNLAGCSKIHILPKFLGRLTNLHILNLSECSRLLSLPESIGNLENLRILNLSKCSSLLSLPSSSSELRQLEKLDISHCKQLCELPKMIEKLTKLRELLNEDCLELKAVPRGIGKLVSLRELSLFVIGKQDRVEHCASISELEHLKLVGELEIKGLENVTNSVDAKAANLIEKNLRSLKLKWNVLSAAEDMDNAQQAEEIDVVLENLQPHQKLAKLVIEGYAGVKFPSWMMNRIDSCLPNLVGIKLVNIPRCSSLPPLGLLPVLEELIIGDMPAVTNLGEEFYGESHINESANKFPALRILELSDMPVLREWVTQRRNKFPALEELSLKRMPVLREWVPVDDEEGRRERVPIFPCLAKLTIEKYPQLRPEPCLPASVESLRSLTSLQELKIRNLADLEIMEDWLGVLTELQSLDIDGCSSLRYLPVHKMTTLTNLSIKDCPLLFNAGGDVRVNERPEPCLPTSVQNLTITGMSKEFLLLILKSLTMDIETPPDDGDTISLQLPNRGLVDLKKEKCQQLTCLPEELSKLRCLKVDDCQSLRYLPAHKRTALTSLSINDHLLLFNADGQFVDTNDDHIFDVQVNGRKYKYKKQVSSLPQKEESSPKEKVRSLKEEKKSWTRCWR